MTTDLRTLWTAGRTWNCPAGWRQGRGAWGGLVAGQVVTAAQATVASDLPVRSVHIAMLGPVPAGPIDVTVTTVRDGTATASRDVELCRAGEVLTRATVVFGAVRAKTAISDPAAATTLTPRAADAQFLELGPPIAPEFLQNLRLAPVTGLPFGGAEPVRTSGWVHVPTGSELTAAVLAALVDAWWTASLAGLPPEQVATGMPPAATLDYLVTFPEAAPRNETMLWHDGEIVAGHDGYLTEIRSLRSQDGRLVAHNMQLVAIGRGALS